MTEQDIQNLGERLLGTSSDTFSAGARERMLDEDVAVIGEAAPPGHALSGLGERLGTQDRGRSAELFEFRGVVQTAPRTRPSIPDGRHHQIGFRSELLQLLRLGQHARLTRGQHRLAELSAIALLQ